MADRRMFSKKIIDSDAFLDMPLSTQALYFHLSMRADDDGFVSNPKRIKQMVGASDDDLKLLILKRFILTFDSGVVVIKHWKIHNLIKNDRYVPTTYTEEFKTLTLDSKKAYTERIQVGTEMEPNWNQNGSKMDPQVSIGKVNSNNDTSYYSPCFPQGRKEEEKICKPTKEDVIKYFTEKLGKPEIAAISFWTWNENRGWLVGSIPMRKWEIFADAWRSVETKKPMFDKKLRGNLERNYTKEELSEIYSDLHNFDDIDI